MNSQSGAILVMAVGLGGSAVWLIAPAVLSTRDTKGSANVPIVMATVDIVRGGTIQADMLRLDSVPKIWASPKAVGRIEDAVGRVVTIPILEGEPVLSSKIAAKGAGVGLAAIIPKGMRAFTIQTTTIAAGVAGLVLPGNKVDVLLTVKEVQGGSQARGGTIILLQNLEILAVDQRVDPEPAPAEKTGTPNKELRSVTLLVTPEQAAKLDLGKSLGTLHLTLRNPADTAEVSSLHLATIAELADRHPGLLAEIPKPKTAPTPPPKREKPAEEIRTIRGRHEGSVKIVR